MASSDTPADRPATFRLAAAVTKLALFFGLVLAATTMLSSFAPDTNSVTVPIAAAVTEVLMIFVPGAVVAWLVHLISAPVVRDELAD